MLLYYVSVLIQYNIIMKTIIIIDYYLCLISKNDMFLVLITNFWCGSTKSPLSVHPYLRLWDYAIILYIWYNKKSLKSKTTETVIATFYFVLRIVLTPICESKYFFFYYLYRSRTSLRFTRPTKTVYTNEFVRHCATIRNKDRLFMSRL